MTKIRYFIAMKIKDFKQYEDNVRKDRSGCLTLGQYSAYRDGEIAVERNRVGNLEIENDTGSIDYAIAKRNELSREYGIPIGICEDD